MQGRISSGEKIPLPMDSTLYMRVFAIGNPMRIIKMGMEVYTFTLIPPSDCLVWISHTGEMIHYDAFRTYCYSKFGKDVMSVVTISDHEYNEGTQFIIS